MRKLLFALLIMGAGLCVLSCNNRPAVKSPSASDSAASRYEPGSFGYDLDFLKWRDSVIVLTDGESSVAISPKYQGKVFTSTAGGAEGRSFGWINYKAFSSTKDKHMNAYGGENRIWLGPEGGRFSLFFSKGDSMDFPHWKTPAPFDTESWKLVDRDARSVSLQKDMQLVNYSGTRLFLSVERRIGILDRHAIDTILRLQLGTNVKAVGYHTENKITNTGAQEWTAATGMPCIWMLDMFHPSPATVILVPYRDGAGKIATTNYFGQIPPDRIKYDKGVLLFKADGKSRGKLGMSMARAMGFAGSYDSQNKVLTIIKFSPDRSGKWLNQEWNESKPPFSGDAVNAYNDGPLADGSQMGPFYELESVSPAAFLKPGASLSHRHSVFHFTGDEAGLDNISRKVLNISLEDVKKAF
jgi:hypothetical protein